MASEGLPSLLVFGPQTEFPSEQVLHDLRQELLSSPRLSVLLKAIDDLPQFWQSLVDFDPSLRQIPGNEHLGQLKQWVKVGGQFPHHESNAPNHYALAVTVLLQITQYSRYLDKLGKDSHRKVLEGVKDGGIQGFCIGFLSAVAVATSESEADLGSSAAVALRLAVSIGAYVDQDGAYAAVATDYLAVAVRWKEGNEEEKASTAGIAHLLPQAYISSINDATSVTFTIRAADLDTLTKIAREKHLLIKVVSVHGRFHTSSHFDAVHKIARLASLSHGLEFPDAKKLQVPVRNTADGVMISQGSLTRLALENSMINVANWYETVKASVEQLPKSLQTIAYAGFGNAIPASLLRTSSLQIFVLGNIDEASNQVNGINGINGVHRSVDPNDLSQFPSHSIAIVGMAGRFPGADSVDELWDLIMEGKTMVEPAPVETFGLPKLREDTGTKWWGNFLNDRDAFDHKFFKKASREALAWDPQQRILLEVVYQALESAGYFGASSLSEEPLDYGCYIGAVMNNYYDNVSCAPATAYATVGTSRCYISGAMSHYFGWTGPSLSIDTACSSSLVAINTACRAIWSGECSRAVAGGTNVITSPFDYQNLAAAGFLSPSGQCKPFDVDADGYCRGEGVAVVVLKQLSDAVRDNDNILGVITGSAANQNRNFNHITQPHSGSQVELYQKVMKLSSVTPESVSYVEAHGTGTGVGDPIEVRSIRDAFGGPGRDSLLRFGSIKGNIGHTEATAGVAGLIKVLLMMRHKKITAQASHTSVNPKIPAFHQSKMEISREIIPWEAPYLLACVNSYGAAGSNSAVMIRQKPSKPTTSAPVPLPSYPLFISAGSANSISQYSKKLLDWLTAAKAEAGSDILASLVFNLADRANHALPHVFTTTVSSVSDLETKLEAAAVGSGIINPPQGKPVVLVFGGQESNFIGLSKTFYQSSKLFRQHLDSVDDLLTSVGNESFYPFIFDSEPSQNLITLHSALFAIQYASAKSWMDSGLKVSAVVGHSFGQLTALAISGALSLSDALRLVSGRASLMQKHWGPEPGSMLFLQADRATVEEILRSLRLGGEGLYAEIACYNGPESHVVVGSSEAVKYLQQHVANTPHLQSSVRTKKLNVTNGFHSRYTEPLLPHLASLAEQLEWRQPDIHLETTDEFESKITPDFQLAAEHTRRPVFFQRAVERLTKNFSDCTWIEAGRGSSVMQLVKLSVPKSQEHAFHVPQLTSAHAQDSLTAVTIDLWKSGHTTQYWPFHRSEKPDYRYLSLPPIQFEKLRHWLPFTGRDLIQDAETVPAQDEDEMHELLTFLNFTDATNKEAVFRIDPKADRFQKMLGGHVMAGQSLAPASLYFEIVARAALLLERDTQAVKFVPTVHDLLMRSPIGQSTTKKISLVLKKLDDIRPSWSFSITTQDTEIEKAEPFEHSTGRVYLKRRNDTQPKQQFERFESLIGHRRLEEVLNNPDAEKMQGKHVYRAFNTVVYYGEAFQGIKQVSCVGFEAAGKVRVTPTLADPADQRLTDTPMTDSFMQFAGFLVNYFNNPSMEDVFVCMKIEHIEIGGAFDPDAGEWLVYSTMNEGGETDAAADAYIFDARTKKMVMAAFGFRFSKMTQSSLARVLKSVNKSANTTSPLKDETPVDASGNFSQQAAITPVKRSVGKRQEVYQILSDVTDISIENLRGDSTLDELQIDSLMATEVLNDIRSILGLTIDLSSFLFFENIEAIVAHIDEKLGISGTGGSDSGYEDEDVSKHSPTPTTAISDSGNVEQPKSIVIVEEPKSTSRPTITSAHRAFNETRFNYDQHAKTTQAVGFWEKEYPNQRRLVLAYVLEAFAELGCDLKSLQSGDDVPQITALGKHALLVRQLYRVLEDGKLIISSGKNRFTRTEVIVDSTPAESIYLKMIDQHPQHATVNKLVRAIGSELATCLRGEKEGVQILFGNRATKKTLEEFYSEWPLFKAPTLVLSDFLSTAFKKATGGGKFRILEIGAGTGGTTRLLVNHLQRHGIEFEYVFTDLGVSLVNAAAKTFKGIEEMSFDVLDIEQPIKPEYEGAFHCVLATNCIHATRNLEVSLKHMRQMLRDDGALALIEITRNVFFFDIIVGLLEGWWLFADGREHALIDEKQWERKMKTAGFGAVAWSEGAAPESQTVRVIAAFPKSDESVTALPATEKSVKAAMETVTYKKIGNLDILADIYYPTEGEALAGKKLPVALMIHGGSQMLFSRKDIRPAQTRLLLAKGFLPVSVDYRLCPEVSLAEGPMVDVCDALEWARYKLPELQLQRHGLHVDGEKVVVVGWSSGGQLAMSLAWTAPLRGLPPPEAALIFYAPTDYEDEWWQYPIQPNGAPYTGQQYDLLEGVRDEPIASYDMVGAWEEPIADPRSQKDPRCRIVLHINWKAQTLPVIMYGLPSTKKADPNVDYNMLPQPPLDIIRQHSPRAHIRQGTYNVPTFFIHGTADDLIPWQQTQGTYQTMREKGIDTDLVLLENGPHICDLSGDPKSDGWKATVKGYNFITSHAI
ncbi:Thiolase-like protein [Glarea lozoyensis ATCC 20868]|uniref:Thiolase-like protein n=1 Tax=Glarea lozoyensis (strain ATCC 20868 / MF5171) TaxID=1116229 RepID=S3CQX3_GLAL2|nr:Thiolase-like protein [Glarea lozoyensis ATCC 20868]EPE28832.1 Thiolase-like protein [Glarea lozoyensis ATCC 20868]